MPQWTWAEGTMQACCQPKVPAVSAAVDGCLFVLTYRNVFMYSNKEHRTGHLIIVL